MLTQKRGQQENLGSPPNPDALPRREKAVGIADVRLFWKWKRTDERRPEEASEEELPVDYTVDSNSCVLLKVNLGFKSRDCAH